MPADIDPECQAFYAQHQAGGPRNVVIVHLFDGENERTAVFSSLTHASTWLEATKAQDGVAVITPMIIDMPEFGNVEPGKLQ